MGRYIQTQNQFNKAKEIAKAGNGEIISSPPSNFDEIPEGKALIVVCNNGFFEAAGYVDSEREFESFTDTRPKDYVLVDKAYAESNAH